MSLKRDLALDPTTGDFDVSGGDLHVTSGAKGIAQSVRIRLSFFRGEWFLDRRAGLPWFQEVLVKTPDPNVIAPLFRAEILGTPGITSIEKLELTRDRAARKLTVNWRAASDEGAIGAVQGVG